jgi:hypothetical protein
MLVVNANVSDKCIASFLVVEVSSFRILTSYINYSHLYNLIETSFFTNNIRSYRNPYDHKPNAHHRESVESYIFVEPLNCVNVANLPAHMTMDRKTRKLRNWNIYLKTEHLWG